MGTTYRLVDGAGRRCLYLGKAPGFDENEAAHDALFDEESYPVVREEVVAEVDSQLGRAMLAFIRGSSGPVELYGEGRWHGEELSTPVFSPMAAEDLEVLDYTRGWRG